VIYLDSSALLKLVFEEPESAALDEWLAARSDLPVVTSELAKVEVVRACRRIEADALPEARALLAALDLIPLTSDVLDDAGNVAEALLRSLDAIHLASALTIRADLSAFVAYDLRLGDAAAVAGLPVVRPET
jgi:predicted nucleic acid-binding protein